MKDTYDYEKIVQTITTHINSQHGWHLVTVYDQKEEVIKDGGNPIGKFSIIKYFNAVDTSNMLIADNRKEIGAMMSKASAAYDKSDGQVYVATSNGAAMGTPFGGENETLIDAVSLCRRNAALYEF